jgi:hypothetical protein
MPPASYAFAGNAPAAFGDAPVAKAADVPPESPLGSPRQDAGPPPVAFAATAVGAYASAATAAVPAADDPHAWKNAGPAPEAFRPQNAP